VTVADPAVPRVAR